MNVNEKSLIVCDGELHVSALLKSCAFLESNRELMYSNHNPCAGAALPKLRRARGRITRMVVRVGNMTKPIKQRYQYLLFDIDNTLMDFTAGEKTALFQTMDELGVIISEADYVKYLEINKAAWARFEAGELDSKGVQRVRFENFAAHLGRNPAEGMGMNARYVENLGQQAILLEGAMDLLQQLSQRYQLAVATNGLTLVQRARLQKSGFLPLLSGVFISQEMGVQKPDQSYYESIFRSFGDLAREKYLMIGDSLSADIQGGINAGIHTLWYHPAGDETPDIAPTYMARSFDEMLALLL